MKLRLSFDANLFKSMEVFSAVAETGQLTAAARLLAMSQSAASQHISNLERSLGAELLDRSVRPVRLTQTGTLVLSHAARMLNAVEDLATDLRHRGPHPISVLRIGILASIATTLTPPLVRLAKDTFRVEDMTLWAGLSEDHETLLRTKAADLVITSHPFYDMDGLERQTIFRENFLLVLPADYHGPLDDMAAILKALPLVRFANSTRVGRRVEQQLRRLKFQAPRVIQADRSSMVTACVSQGMGFTILTPSLLIDGLAEQMGLQIRPLPFAGMSRTLTVIARRRELDDLPDAFASLARKVLTRQIAKHMGAVGLAAIFFGSDTVHSMN